MGQLSPYKYGYGKTTMVTVAIVTGIVKMIPLNDWSRSISQMHKRSLQELIELAREDIDHDPYGRIRPLWRLLIYEKCFGGIQLIERLQKGEQYTSDLTPALKAYILFCCTTVRKVLPIWFDNAPRFLIQYPDFINMVQVPANIIENIEASCLRNHPLDIYSEEFEFIEETISALYEVEEKIMALVVEGVFTVLMTTAHFRLPFYLFGEATLNTLSVFDIDLLYQNQMFDTAWYAAEAFALQNDEKGIIGVDGADLRRCFGNGGLIEYP
jgi:hypothetical protein